MVPWCNGQHTCLRSKLGEGSNPSGTTIISNFFISSKIFICMETKKCCTCNKEKFLGEFNFKNKKNNVLHCSCKECWKETRKKNYEKNKSVTFDRNHRNRTRVKKWFEEFKTTLKCIKCDENHPACLDFHHRDPSTKEYTVSFMLGGTFSIESIKNEIEKCDILCANCHRKLHYDEVTERRYNKWIIKNTIME